MITHHVRHHVARLSPASSGCHDNRTVKVSHPHSVAPRFVAHNAVSPEVLATQLRDVAAHLDSTVEVRFSPAAYLAVLCDAAAYAGLNNPAVVTLAVVTVDDADAHAPRIGHQRQVLAQLTD